MDRFSNKNEFELWKTDVISSFNAWIQELKPDTYASVEEPSENPDQFTFFTILKAVQTETRKSNRKITDTLNSIDERLNLLKSPLADDKTQDNLTVILLLMEITDRIIRIQKQLFSPPRKRLFFNDKRWIKYQAGIRDAINLLLSNIENIFIRNGIERIKTVGENFDPFSMYAVTVEKTDKYPENCVIDEFCAGYKYNGKIVRLAEVCVAKV